MSLRMRAHPSLILACGVKSRIEHLFAKAKGSEKGSLPFFTHYGDVTDLNNLVRRSVSFATRHLRTMHCKNALQSAWDRGTRSHPSIGRDSMGRGSMGRGLHGVLVCCCGVEAGKILLIGYCIHAGEHR